MGYGKLVEFRKTKEKGSLRLWILSKLITFSVRYGVVSTLWFVHVSSNLVRHICKLTNHHSILTHNAMWRSVIGPTERVSGAEWLDDF